MRPQSGQRCVAAESFGFLGRARNLCVFTVSCRPELAPNGRYQRCHELGRETETLEPDVSH